MVPREETLSRQIRAGLIELLEARRCARQLGRDVWEFALEIAALGQRGWTHTDLRRLVCAGWLEHRREITRPHDDRRRFRRSVNLSFADRSCFVLTPAGADIVGRWPERGAPVPATGQPHLPPVPCWDSDRRVLTLSGTVIKQFKVPARQQELVLGAFEGQGWPPRIADPLPRVSGVDSRRRLREAIKSLNRNQKHRLLQFTGDGQGTGVCWNLVVVVPAPHLNGSSQPSKPRDCPQIAPR